MRYCVLAALNILFMFKKYPNYPSVLDEWLRSFKTNHKLIVKHFIKITSNTKLKTMSGTPCLYSKNS
jgi:hypothetical protein